MRRNEEEFHRLLAAVRAGDRNARDRLVENNMALVAHIVRRFRPPADEYDDFFQVGCIGLLKAIDRFDPDFGVRFSTYAVPVVMGEIRQYARSRHPLRVGRTLHDLARRALDAQDELARRGRPPTVGEIARHLDVDAEDVALALETTRSVLSLDAPAAPGEPDGLRVADRLAADPRAGEAGAGGDNFVLREALSRLTPWERRLIGLRFFADKSQTEVARRLGVSQAHVSRTERRILRTFRQFIDP